MAPPRAADPSAALAGAARAAIRMLDNRFEPAVISVPVGVTVNWSNPGLNLHTATAFEGAFDTGTVVPGATAQLTFDRPGTYRYFCRQHLLAGMSGTIHVV